jgi:hypothetical protein
MRAINYNSLTFHIIKKIGILAQTWHYNQRSHHLLTLFYLVQIIYSNLITLLRQEAIYPRQLTWFYRGVMEPIPGDTPEPCGNLVFNHYFIDANQARGFNDTPVLTQHLLFVYRENRTLQWREEYYQDLYIRHQLCDYVCCGETHYMIQQNQRQVELFPCYLTQSRFFQWSVNISTAKVISTSFCGIFHLLLGMLFMRLNFTQVQSANIISMHHLNNVWGDWINIAGRQAHNPLQWF